MVECKDCTEHTGMVARLNDVERRVGQSETREEKIMNRLNQILGAVLVAGITVAGSSIFPIIFNYAPK